MYRKTAPRVRDGRVQKKNNWTPARNDYYRIAQSEPMIDRRRPGDGYRHLLTCADVRAFISLLPDWDEMAVGLDAIVLAPGEADTDGWHSTGVVAVCAWEKNLLSLVDHRFFESHRALMDRLEVEYEKRSPDVLCKWTEPAARAYQLLHVLLHEIGHHHDRVTTRSMQRAARGEPFAESYARRYADVIWDAYLMTFGL